MGINLRTRAFLEDQIMAGRALPTDQECCARLQGAYQLLNGDDKTALTSSLLIAGRHPHQVSEADMPSPFPWSNLYQVLQEEVSADVG
jgi:hypothetical protein